MWDNIIYLIYFINPFGGFHAFRTIIIAHDVYSLCITKYEKFCAFGLIKDDNFVWLSFKAGKEEDKYSNGYGKRIFLKKNIYSNCVFLFC